MFTQLANFPNPAGLNSLGGNLYAATDASGDPTVGVPGGQEGLGAVMQGYVEQSKKMFETMQEQMAKQTEQMLGAFGIKR